MKVKYIENTSRPFLTKDKVYEVVSVNSHYNIIDDTGTEGKYSKSRFETVKEEEKVKKVKCINKGCNTLIEVGKVYEVVKENSNYYFIDPSNVGLIDYNKNLFVEVTDMKEYTLGDMIKEYEGKFVGQFKRVSDGKIIGWRRDGVLIWEETRENFMMTQFALMQKYVKVEDLEVTYIGALKELEAGKEAYCIYEGVKSNYDNSSRAINLEKLYKAKWYIKA